MKTDPLTESLESGRNAAALREHAGAEPPLHRIAFSISGPGFADSEEFDVADIRAARASARKLMASAVRLFGHTDAPPGD